MGRGGGDVALVGIRLEQGVVDVFFVCCFAGTVRGLIDVMPSSMMVRTRGRVA